MNDEEPVKPEFSFADYGYTAFEKWPYQQLIYIQEVNKSWIDFGESFYRASELIVERIANDQGHPDVEGLAAVFLFRHYLELALKRIVVRGRVLIRHDKNAAWEDVKEVAKIHSLDDLWKLVLAEAKPKIEQRIWGSYDIDFVEKCIAEFDARDKKGFAFRYPLQGGERYEIDFPRFRLAMEHVYQILENMTTVLVETHAENAEWEAILREEAGF
jgi:hypothetical protein